MVGIRVRQGRVKVRQGRVRLVGLRLCKGRVSAG